MLRGMIRLCCGEFSAYIAGNDLAVAGNDLAMLRESSGYVAENDLVVVRNDLAMLQEMIWLLRAGLGDYQH